jgi:hypothetical protein
MTLADSISAVELISRPPARRGNVIVGALLLIYGDNREATMRLERGRGQRMEIPSTYKTG